MTEETAVGILDDVRAELIECVPDPPAPVVLPVPLDPPSPQDVIRDATIAQTGADPPPG